MQSLYSKLVTKASTGRILGIKPASILRLEPAEDQVMVELKDGRTLYVSAQDYVQHFVDFRKESAKSLTAVVAGEDKFLVYNPKSDAARVISVVSGEIQCQCDDYKNSRETFDSEVACKHIYAVLDLMGFSSLQRYVDVRESAAEWSEINAEFEEIAARVELY